MAPHGGAGSCAVTLDRFRSHLALLAALGWTSVSLDDVAAVVTGNSDAALPNRPYVLTFDDGYRELLDYAIPALEAAGIKATLFVLAGLREDRWIDRGDCPNLELLRSDELRDLARRGFAIGSHTGTHVCLTELDDTALEREVAGARARLAEMCRATVDHFSYPFGLCDARSRDAVIRAGYRTACTTNRGRARPGMDLYTLPRLSVGKRMGTLRFARRALFR